MNDVFFVKLSVFLSRHVARVCLEQVLVQRCEWMISAVDGPTASSLKNKGENSLTGNGFPVIKLQILGWWWRPVITATCWWVLTSSILWLLRRHLTNAQEIMCPGEILGVNNHLLHNLLIKLKHSVQIKSFRFFFLNSVDQYWAWSFEWPEDKAMQTTKTNTYKINRTHKWDSNFKEHRKEENRSNKPSSYSLNAFETGIK